MYVCINRLTRVSILRLRLFLERKSGVCHDFSANDPFFPDVIVKVVLLCYNSLLLVYCL